ncbi:MAG TPA: hypothetical protein VM534_00395 [Thermoanaerobaculia bacterium]|nr:hypothetical protein [Thermoanaerobaculia bacterium]
MTISRNRLPPPAVLGLLIVLPLLSGCFEEPVSETVEIEFLDEGNVRVTTIVELNEEASQNRFAFGRLQAMRKSILEGLDPWTRRYAAMRAEREIYTLEKTEGEIHRMERSAIVSASELALFFSDSVPLFVTERDGQTELAIYPGTSLRSTVEQRRILDQRMRIWTDALASYFGSTERLYRYLENHPDRATPVFAEIFSTFILDEERESFGELSEDEEALTDEVKQAIEQASSVLLVPDDDAYTLNEISRLVHDPFPADLRVKVHGEIIRSAGFDLGEQGDLIIRGVGIWEALESLVDRWIAPDLLLTWVEAARDGKRFDVVEFASLPRRVGPLLTASEIRGEIEGRLRPEPAYRVLWQNETRE